MNQQQRSTSQSSPHDRYREVVKMRSRLKRALVLGVFITISSIIGVIFIHTDSIPTVIQTETIVNDVDSNATNQSIIPISENNNLEELADSNSTDYNLNELSFSVSGTRREQELISFIIEGRTEMMDLKIDLGNGIRRDIDNDTLFYRYKHAGRFMSYLILLDEAQEIKADSQYFEIANAQIENVN